MASKAALKRTGKKAVSSAAPPSRSGARQPANVSRRIQKAPNAAARTTIAVQGARVHNLKNISLEIPRDSLIVVTGLSGSGKSSLAFDTIYAEGQRRYMESLSSYAKRFVAQVAKPDVDFVFGLSPVISIEQKTIANNPRSTVGTMTDVASYLNLLFATIANPHCPRTGEPAPSRTSNQILEAILALPELSLAVAIPSCASVTIAPQVVAAAPVFTVTFAGALIVGAVTSFTVNVVVAVLVLPTASVAMIVIVCVPIPTAVPASGL